MILRVGASIIKGQEKWQTESVSWWFLQARPIYRAGIKRRPDRYLHGSRRYRDEPELQRMLGKLSGRDR